jgi:hypothetical protein
LGQFPGAAQNMDAPVSARLEKLVNTVLLAPSFEDALSGIYQVLMGALCKSYQLYAVSAHPIHDAPTIATLHEVIGFHEQMRLWLREYRRRFPHTIDAAYKAAIEAELRNCADLLEALPLEGEGAAPVGVNTAFVCPRVRTSGRVASGLCHQAVFVGGLSRIHRSAPPVLGLCVYARNESGNRPTALDLRRPLHALGIFAGRFSAFVGRIAAR